MGKPRYNCTEISNLEEYIYKSDESIKNSNSDHILKIEP